MDDTRQIGEFDLLTGVLRGESLTCPPSDPSHFLQLIQDHRLISGISRHVNQIQDENLKEAILAASMANKIYQLRLVNALHEIHSLLASIPFLVLKGPVLSQLLYNDPAERTSRDLDILVEKENFHHTLKLFLDQNYQLLTRFTSEKQQDAILEYFHHVELLHPSGDVLVELHWNLTALKSIRANITQLMQKTVPVGIGKINYRTLGIFDQFGYLSVHATFHAFSRLQWLMDIHDLRAQLDENEEIELMSYLQNEGLSNFYLVALMLLEEVFGAHVKEEWRVRYHKSPEVKALVKIAREQMRANDSFLHGPTGYGGLEETMRIHRIQYHSGGFKGLIKSLIARNVRPQNWEFYVFPDKVFGLNHLFSRPIWLLRRLFSRKS